MASVDEDIQANETTVLRSAPWLRLANLADRLATAGHAPDAFRVEIRDAHAELVERFRADESVETLVHARAELIDVILREVWRSQLPPGHESWALVAVGGYGRGELHPHSDIDILILVPAAPDDAGRSVVERVVTFLWDINLEVGHSVRTVAECAEESTADVGVMTTLIEARQLSGNAQLMEEMRAAVSAERIWPVREYFEAKVAEQNDRHLKANDTAYNLEPNVKTGPGGLRDIQTIAWVAKRHFDASSLDELLTHGFLSFTELRKLKQAQSFLWKVRFGLHVLTGRREDRLLFDHQIKLAQSFGYEDGSYTLAVEQFMQRYYRNVMDVLLLNELLLQ
ncbi:MAG TPA: nucleotidyltransferase domain-containing protein, partial [Steroidobacteraceae bacterium]|nr:nucleotidyltransferase domain-containing protein [Steroidobacteraceae bacterium]